MAALSVLCLSGLAFQGGHVSERSSAKADMGTRLPAADSASCNSAKRGLRFYTKRASEHRAKMGAREGAASPSDLPQTCPQVRRAAEVARWNAYKARYHAERFLERMRDPAKAICHVFGAYCAQAIAVAKCESGWSMTPRAHNGQFLGSFQMGSYARARYGHGDTVLEQARAAYAYFKAAGSDWSPWSCRWAA